MMVALVSLGVLEYQWSGTVTEANREEMRSNLHSTLLAMQKDFYYKVLDLCDASRLNSAKQWQVPSFVAHAYLVKAGVSDERLAFEIDRLSGEFNPVEDPPEMATLMRSLRAGAPEFQAPRAQPALWTFANGTPVLLQRLSAPKALPGFSYLVLEFSVDTLRNRSFPEIVHSRLGDGEGGEYYIGVLNGRHPLDPIYQSSPGLAAGFFSSSDDRLTLVGSTPVLPLSSPEGPDSWEIVAKHRRGSLDAAVASIRTRLLWVNFAVLLVLALGLVTILVYALRSQNLLRLQMEFVASVSHELRTPLSVIGSAADNLAEGVVRSEGTVRDYGALIRSECRRLSALVEQTLRFAAGKADYRPRNFQFLRVPDLVDRTLGEASALLDASAFKVVTDFHPGLPLVRVDTHLLSECLLNLISNAVKYSGGRRWIRIRAVPVETGRGTGVKITVEDRGIGIAAEELPHIFEPFYRGREARSAQIQGTGLGLCLAQEAASSMGARITVESAPGEGSTFAIHLPAAYMNSSTVPVEAIVES